MDDKTRDFRDGLFSLNTTRLGTVAEIIVSTLIHAGPGNNRYHDLYHVEKNERVEVKCSRVLRKSTNKITRGNVIAQCVEERLCQRAVSFEEAERVPFDCNIQQIKCSEFDVIYYVLLFKDCACIMSLMSSEVKDCDGYSDKQHKGNKGEGQFHVTNDNLAKHIKDHLRWRMSYQEIYDMLAPRITPAEGCRDPG